MQWSHQITALRRVSGFSAIACTLLPSASQYPPFRPPSYIICLLQVRESYLRLSKREILCLSSSQYIPEPNFQEVILSIHTFIQCRLTEHLTRCWVQMTRNGSCLPAITGPSFPYLVQPCGQCLSTAMGFSFLHFYPVLGVQLFPLRKYLCGPEPPFSQMNIQLQGDDQNIPLPVAA